MSSYITKTFRVEMTFLMVNLPLLPTPPPLPCSLLISPPLFSSTLLSLPLHPLPLHTLLSISSLSLLGPKVPKKPRLATHSSFLESDSEDEECAHQNGVAKRCINDYCVFCCMSYCLNWNFNRVIPETLNNLIITC